MVNDDTALISLLFTSTSTNTPAILKVPLNLLMEAGYDPRVSLYEP